MIETFLFWALAFAAVASALCVVVLRNPVNCVMALLAAMLATAGLYALMGAYVVAWCQAAENLPPWRRVRRPEPS